MEFVVFLGSNVDEEHHGARENFESSTIQSTSNHYTAELESASENTSPATPIAVPSNPDYDEPEPELWRSYRIRRAQGAWWRSNLAMSYSHSTLTYVVVPWTFQEAVEGADSIFEKPGMQSELASHFRNETWKLVPQSEGRNVLRGKWAIRLKKSEEAFGRGVPKVKERLVARDFLQIYDNDYRETYAPVVKFTSIRCLLSIIAHLDFELHKMDVVMSFLNDKVQEDI